MIINVWQQINGKKENILGLEMGKIEIWRLKSATILSVLCEKFRTKIQHFMARQMERKV